MATHNGAEYIVEQISTILSQLNDDDEIVISDDGSKDNTLQLIKDFNDSRIKVIRFTQQTDFRSKKLSSYYYATANFMHALRHAKGDYIFLSDQDDRWHPNKVSECIRALHEYDLVSHNFAIMDRNGRIENPKFLKKYPNNISIWKAAYQLPFRGCCLALNRYVLDNVLPTIPEGIFLHDCYIGLCAVCRGFRFGFIDQSLIDYRRHSTNVSSMISENNIWFKISYRLQMLIQIFRNKPLRK